MTRLACLLFLMVTLGLAQWATAENAVKDGTVYTRKALGEVHKMDFTEREAVISGFRYYFGSVVSGDNSEVKLLGSNAGSFEMLEPGMKLLLFYAETGVSRYVVKAEQLPYDTDIHDRETRNRLLN